MLSSRESGNYVDTGSLYQVMGQLVTTASDDLHFICLLDRGIKTNSTLDIVSASFDKK